MTKQWFGTFPLEITGNREYDKTKSRKDDVIQAKRQQRKPANYINSDLFCCLFARRFVISSGRKDDKTIIDDFSPRNNVKTTNCKVAKITHHTKRNQLKICQFYTRKIWGNHEGLKMGRFSSFLLIFLLPGWQVLGCISTYFLASSRCHHVPLKSLICVLSRSIYIIFENLLPW